MQKLNNFLMNKNYSIELSRFGSHIMAKVRDGRNHVYGKNSQELIGLGKTVAEALDNLVKHID